jgi:hypothetical protein
MRPRLDGGSELAVFLCFEKHYCDRPRAGATPCLVVVANLQHDRCNGRGPQSLLERMMNASLVPPNPVRVLPATHPKIMRKILPVLVV